MSKKKVLLSVVSIALASMVIGGLASCGTKTPTQPSQPTVKPSDDPTPPVVPSVVVDPLHEAEPAKYVSLGEEFVREAGDATYFAPHLVYSVDENGVPFYASAKNNALLKAGESVNLFAYGLPEGFSTGVTVTDLEGHPVEDLFVSDTGVVTAPSVTERTDFLLYLFAVNKATGESYKKYLEVSVVPAEQYASDVLGWTDFTGRNGEEREKMAGVIEEYMYNNGIAPIGVMDDGGFQLYSERIHTPFLDANYYVPNYGYGILAYGSITEPLAEEKTDAWKLFLHDQEAATNEIGNFNYLSSNSAATEDFYSYIASSYFGRFVNAKGTGAGYEGFLSRTDAPIAVNPDANGASDTWKVKVRVGGASDNEAMGVTKGLTFRTNTQVAELKAFDHRDIQLKDYLTPFKLLGTGAVNWYRGNEQAAESTANRQIKGFAEYYEATMNNLDLPTDEEYQKNVGVKLDYTDNSITIQFNGKITPDYAEYQIDGLWSNPISEEFVTALGDGSALKGASLYGKTSAGFTPLDTILCTGPYFTEYYEAKKTVTFAKNTDWPAVLSKDNAGRDLYRIPGIHLNINAAVGQNKNAYIDMFEAGLTDYSNIPEEYWDKYVTDPRRKAVDGSNITGTSLKMNMWDAAFYEQRFGDDTGWTVQPCLSNDAFYKGLALGIDKITIATKYHHNARYEMCEPSNLVSPKADHVYNSSDAHNQAVQNSFNGELEDFENWKDNAAGWFEIAIDEELAAGHYTLGTEAEPSEFTIHMSCMESDTLRERYNMILANWKESFELAVKSHINTAGQREWCGANGNPLIVFNPVITYIPQVDDNQMQNDFIYSGVQAGVWDAQLVYYISGNALDVLNGFDKYKSDNSSGFSLNFCLDTSVPSAEIFYDGKYWSFDALWEASNAGTFLSEHGKKVAPFDFNTNLSTYGVEKIEGVDYIVWSFPLSTVSAVTITDVFADVCDHETGDEYYDVLEKWTLEDGVFTAYLPVETCVPLEWFYGPSYAEVYWLEVVFVYNLDIGSEVLEELEAQAYTYDYIPGVPLD